jgi:hypothetical protein
MAFDPRDLRSEFHIEDRSQLIYALTEAAALEHVLMCQYLFAAASLKTHLSELNDCDRKYFQLERIRYWKRKLTEVAREEMQHLAMAMNLLIAVGGAPTFARPNFPNINLYYKDLIPGEGYRGLLMSLEKFSGRPKEAFSTIDRFVRFESPFKPGARELLFTSVPQPNTYDTVGQLYRAIQDAFGRISNVIIDKSDQYDPSDEDAQSVRLPNRPPIPAVVTTPAEAQAMIDQIIDQGEGYPDTSYDPRSHYEIFLRIRREFENERSLDPHFDPSRDVAPNPSTRTHEDAVDNPITLVTQYVDGGLQYDLLQLFAGAYEVLLGWLGQLFSGSGTGPMPPKLRAAETLTFLPFMSEVVSPLAELLTHIPTKFGESTRIGASFEVTSNDFLRPSLDISTELTSERLSDLVRLSEKCSTALRDHGADEAAGELAFIAKTLALTLDEIGSRSIHGWPPQKSDWDYSYSETVPDDFEFVFKDVAVLELQFEGVFQCRLATDPDGATVPRGVTGNGFAIGDEPDLNRAIYFQARGASQRSHCPPIGVYVHVAHVLRKSTNPMREKGELIASLRGARVDLAGEPKFEGRNHIVSEDGEPIDPFVLEVQSSTGLELRRRTIGRPLNDMTPLQRRGTGRYPPAGANASPEAMAANLAILSRVDERFKFEEPLGYTLDRINRLTKDFDQLKDSGRQFSKEGAEIEFRLRSLDEGLRSPMELDARPIRWIRYFFDCSYRHFVSGEMAGNLGALSERFELVSPLQSESAARWLVQYRLGFFDSDAMSACVSGKLYIPVREKTAGPTSS